MMLDHAAIAFMFFWSGGWGGTGYGAGLKAFIEDKVFLADWYYNFREFILFIFFFTCGISNTFSKNNFKRAIYILGAAALVTLVSNAIGEVIIFGVLNMIGFSILIFCGIEVLSKLIYKGRGDENGRKKLLALMCLFLGALFCYLHNYTAARYLNAEISDFSAFFIFNENFHARTADYFTIFQYGGLILLGSTFAYFFYPNRKSLLKFLDPDMPKRLEYSAASRYKHFDPAHGYNSTALGVKIKLRWYRPINFIGRHGLVFYLAHQVIIMGILALLSYFYVTPGVIPILP